MSPVPGRASIDRVDATSAGRGESPLRDTGIRVIGDVPWGTHFCLFYRDKQDLVELLVPYFAAGLRGGEFCMWVTSEALTSEEAAEALRAAVPDLDRRREAGQLEIIPYTEWYLQGGRFDMRRVLDGWVSRLEAAQARGWKGLRLTGNTIWLERSDWTSFVDYEHEVNRVIGCYRMLAACTYSLERCTATDVLDVVRNHQFALVRQDERWEVIESSELQQAREAARQTEQRYQQHQ